MGDSKLWGKYRGIVQDNNDPKMKGCLRVICPAIYGEEPSPWALPSIPPNVFTVPQEGDMVWLEFENGDAEFPIWTGWIPKGEGNDTQAPFQETHNPLTDKGGSVVDPDKLEHQSNEADNFEHSVYHQHPPYYTPHRYGFRTPNGHEIEINDDIANGYIKIKSKDGHEVTMQENTSTKGYIKIEDIEGQTILIDTDSKIITIESNNNVLVHAPNQLTLKGDSKVVIDSPNTEITGDTKISNNLDVGANINAVGSIIDGGGNTANHSH